MVFKQLPQDSFSSCSVPSLDSPSSSSNSMLQFSTVHARPVHTPSAAPLSPHPGCSHALTLLQAQLKCYFRPGRVACVAYDCTWEAQAISPCPYSPKEEKEEEKKGGGNATGRGRRKKGERKGKGRVGRDIPTLCSHKSDTLH